SAERAAPAAAGGALLDDLQQRTFGYFWDLAHPRTLLVPDRWPTRSFSSVAAVGFGLTAVPIGVERGWVSRAEGRARVLGTLRFLWRLPQGPEPAGTAGYRGFFYHFLEPATGMRFERVELSTVDTALLLAGALFCQSYFDRDQAEEAEIRDLAERLYRRVEWPWAQDTAPLISMGWHPETGFIETDWRGYSEAMLVYLLALGSPTHPVGPEAWEAWTSSYEFLEFHGYRYLAFAPLFGHHYSHVWIDFRGIRDAPMRALGFDYFENSRRAALAQRAWAIENPRGWEGLGEDLWGVTACDGPADVELPVRGEPRRFWTYAGRGVGADATIDDGTVAPTGAVASLPFAPEAVLPTIAAMRARWGAHLWGEYGFLDALNPTFRWTDVPVRHGRVVPGVGWFDTDYLGIDQGPILALVENHRSELVWRVMRRNPHLRRGLERAGFTGGWLGSAPD
ncbi:MAG: Tat pathway signal protein, partial [Thermoanaerobaculia bacterium]